MDENLDVYGVQTDFQYSTSRSQASGRDSPVEGMFCVDRQERQGVAMSLDRISIRIRVGGTWSAEGVFPGCQGRLSGNSGIGLWRSVPFLLSISYYREADLSPCDDLSSNAACLALRRHPRSWIDLCCLLHLRSAYLKRLDFRLARLISVWHH